MKKLYSIITVALLAMAAVTLSCCNPDSEIAYTLDGVWEGNMYKQSYYSGRYYETTSTVMQFDQDPYSYAQGTGRWIDYYSNAPWDYYASYITWTVVNRRIRIYSEKEGQTYYIDNYWLDDNRFEGTISDTYGNSKNFVMTKTYSRNWNSYYWNGYYGSGYYNGYYAPSRNSAKGVKASPEKPVTSIKAD